MSGRDQKGILETVCSLGYNKVVDIAADDHCIHEQAVYQSMEVVTEATVEQCLDHNKTAFIFACFLINCIAL